MQVPLNKLLFKNSLMQNIRYILKFNYPAQCPALDITQVHTSIFKLHFTVGSKPIKAFCELPRGVTQIGESTTVDIGKCPTLGCFSQEFDYQTPMDQVVALLESSSECHQTLELQCFLAPLEVSFKVSYNLRLIIHPLFLTICFTIFFHELFSV